MFHDLDCAIGIMEAAIEMLPYQCAPLNVNLGRFLYSRFKVTKSVEDINRAVTTLQLAVMSTPTNYPDYAMHISALGDALRARFQATESMDDLNHTINVLENVVAVELFPSSVSILNLSTALYLRFERLGWKEDLGRAIDLARDAVALQHDNNVSYANALHSLSGLLAQRFIRTSSLDDLDGAVAVGEQAVTISDDKKFCHNLSDALHQRSVRTGSLADVDRAIMINQDSLASIPDDHNQRSIWLNRLCGSLYFRFRLTGSFDDIDKSISMMEEAVASAYVNSIDRVKWLGNLGRLLYSKFELTDSIDDLERAIADTKKALLLAPSQYPGTANFLKNLATMLKTRFIRIKGKDDLDCAIASIEQVMDMEVAAPSLRIAAANEIRELLIKVLPEVDLHRAHIILKKAVRLLPMFSSRALKLRDQQHNISLCSGITSMAVSIALQCGEAPYEALELSELGRGVLANVQLETRSDISTLHAEHPILARQFEDLRDQIDLPQPSIKELSLTDSISETGNRLLLSAQINDLLETIRAKPGFQRFILGPSELELRKLSENGPIVVINVSELRSDAIIVTQHHIKCLQLSVQHIELLNNVDRFLNAVQNVRMNTYHKAREEVQRILEWLWDVVVEPIVDILALKKTPEHDWPRVWWVGCGLLSVLPIHAAGYHEDGSGRTLIDRVVSSYIPTIKSLSYARERASKSSCRSEIQKIMLIGMIKTPGQADLPGVAEEIREVQHIVRHIKVTTLPNPTRAAVISNLPDHQIVHFCCHGQSEFNPSQSKLFLNDWEMTPLTVADLMTLNFQSAQFAFLSACHTANTQDFRLLDESISLCSALQLTGYPSVVGSMWQISDGHSPEVAKGVYSSLLEAGKELDIFGSAKALHTAVHALRESTRRIPGFNRISISNPLVWAPYIHFGI